MNSEKIVLFEDKHDCCGCTACASVCPVQAISMQPDDEGFLYPVIDDEKCIRCRNCLKVCPFRQ